MTGQAIGLPKQGWNLVQFTNGSVGVGWWTGSSWNWGSTLAPYIQNLVPIKVTYIGSSYSAIGNNPAALEKALGQLPAVLSTTLIAMFDHGANTLNNRPVLFDAKGKPFGESGTTQSEATPVNPTPDIGLPSWTESLGKILAWIGTASNWLRVLEFVGGAVMIGIAMRELAYS